MLHRGLFPVIVLIIILFGAAALYQLNAWSGGGPADRDMEIIVERGSSLGAVAALLEQKSIITSRGGFLLRARLFGNSDDIKAGEFAIPQYASESAILSLLQSGKPIRRFITIAEGTPSILVYEKLLAEPLLTGRIDPPEEGSILPETYSFERGEDRGDILARMQAAMDDLLIELWATRGPDIAVNSVRDALILASIVEKETGVASERPMVAAVFSNRLRRGMKLQADPTIIYPITKGKPLGRPIRRSEILAVNDYNTYTLSGLPKGPITNPGRDAIAAVLNPPKSDSLFFVADGGGGHAFARTLAEHQENVRKWRNYRRRTGQ